MILVVPDKPLRIDDHAFLDQAFCIGRHGTRTAPAQFRMMGAIGQEAEPVSFFIKDSANKGHVRQVGTTDSGVIGDDDIARSGIESL